MIGGLLLAGMGRAAAQGDATQSKGGVYSLAQAARGDTLHRKLCSKCHTAADHTNADFKSAWYGQTVLSLFTYIRSTMPDDGPGDLAEQEYLDVTAYILKLNGVAAGTAAMVNDSNNLKKYKIEVADTTGKGGGRAISYDLRHFRPSPR